MRTWIDRLTETVAPQWTLRRVRARSAVKLFRHYEAASVGRRTQGWNRSGGDANATIGPSLTMLRASARDLVRNNPYAESALTTIADHAVGWGIVGKPRKKGQARALEAWKGWAETTACDADGRHDLYGLQKLVMRTMVESGELLIRRRFRRPEDGLPLPIQIQILDPDFLDTLKDVTKLPGGGRIVQGVEFDAIGRRVAYWLFPEHPGASQGGFTASQRVSAENVRHVFRPLRPGQARGLTWFASTLLRFKDFDEYEDATLMKQKVAACLALVTTDPTGSGAAVGTPDDTATPPIDNLQPAAILNFPAGRTVEVVEPPSVAEYANYSQTQLRAIATGLGVTYEDLTGDYNNMPFSAARMSRLRHWARVDDWRWRLLIPQFCDPVWGWAMQAAGVLGLAPADGLEVEWTPPPAPMVDPVNEGLAFQRNIRIGIQSLSDAIRERGYDPDTLFAEMAEDWQKIDALGLVLDCDPRKMTQQGQLHESLSLRGDQDGDELADAAEPEADAKRRAPARRLRLDRVNGH